MTWSNLFLGLVAALFMFMAGLTLVTLIEEGSYFCAGALAWFSMAVFGIVTMLMRGDSRA